MKHTTLYHHTPGWVEPGSFFHIRIRCAAQSVLELTDPAVASSLLASVLKYSETNKWFHYLFLIMPDHIHAILAFPRGSSMSRTVGAWKQYHARSGGIIWQKNYFDHRIRSDDELLTKSQYIRLNPVVKGLCAKSSDWPWVLGACAEMPSGTDEAEASASWLCAGIHQ